MKAHWFNKHISRLTYSIIYTVVLCLASQSVLPQVLYHYPGAASFKSDYSVVFFQKGVSGLYFDTSAYVGYRDSIPAWRFIDSLKVDGLVRDGKYEELIEESQMEGVHIDSPELTSLMHRNKVYRLLKTFPGAVPYDTLVWSKVRQKYNILEDLAQYFIIKFNSTFTVDTVLFQLKSISGITKVSTVPIPYRDTTCTPPVRN